MQFCTGGGGGRRVSGNLKERIFKSLKKLGGGAAEEDIEAPN